MALVFLAPFFGKSRLFQHFAYFRLSFYVQICARPNFELNFGEFYAYGKIWIKFQIGFSKIAQIKTKKYGFITLTDAKFIYKSADANCKKHILGYVFLTCIFKNQPQPPIIVRFCGRETPAVVYPYFKHLIRGVNFNEKGNEKEYAKFIRSRLAHAPLNQKIRYQKKGGIEALIDKYAP